MRAHTEGKNEMGRRFATVIGVAAAGVMALGAQAHGGIAAEKQKQKLGNAVKVNASCGDEACTPRAEGKLLWFTGSLRSAPTNVRQGKLKPVSADLGPGETATLKLKLTKKTRRQADKALDEGKKVLAKITVDATDAVAHDETLHMIRLVK